MKNLITLTIICLTLLSQIQGQGLSPNKNTPVERYQLTKGQHEVGLSLDLNQGDGANFSIVHRYGLLKNLLLRSQLILPTSHSWGETTIQKQLQRAGASLGLERHFAIGKRWSLYTGAEVGVTYSKNYTDQVKATNSTTTIFANAFAGAKYHANKRLSFFAEAKYGCQSHFYKSSQIKENFNNAAYGFQVGAFMKLGKL